METAYKQVKTNGTLVQLVKVHLSEKLLSCEIFVNFMCEIFVNFMYYILLEDFRYRLPEKLWYIAWKLTKGKWRQNNVILPKCILILIWDLWYHWYLWQLSKNKK